jgi:hypothetical protein
MEMHRCYFPISTARQGILHIHIISYGVEKETWPGDMTSPPNMPQSGATLVFMFPDTAQPIDANLDKNVCSNGWGMLTVEHDVTFFYQNNKHRKRHRNNECEDDSYET